MEASSLLIQTSGVQRGSNGESAAVDDKGKRGRGTAAVGEGPRNLGGSKGKGGSETLAPNCGTSNAERH